MSDLKISQLPDGTPAITTDIFPIERSFIGNFRLTIQNILTFIATYLFPSLTATTFTSVTINSDSLKATSDVSVAGDLLVSGTTTHTGLVTNNDTVTTDGAVTHNGTTTLSNNVSFVGTAISYGNMTHNGTTTFNGPVTRGTYSVDGVGTKLNGPLTTNGTTNLATGAVLTGTPASTDASNKIATTAFCTNVQFGYQYWINRPTYVLNQTYYNTSTKPIAIFVSGRTNEYSNYILSLYVNGTFVARAILQGNRGGEAAMNFGQTVWGMVPPGQSYMLEGNLAGIHLYNWMELS